VPGAAVAVLAPHGAASVAAMLGVWKAGAVYVPVDPAYPEERRRFMLEDAQASFLLEPGKPPFALRRAAPCAEPSAAYVIYTSGSTGTPKGVAVGHAGAANYMTAIAGVWTLAPADRVLLFSSMGFDSSLEEILPALHAGACVVVRTPDMSVSAREFARVVEEKALTVLDLPTAYWHELAAVLEPAGWELPPAVRLLVLSGETLRPGSLGLWRRAAARCRLLNEYGPTEATVICAVHELSPAHPADRPVPAGRAVAGARLHVLGEDKQPVPAGEAGELYIGGPGVSLGYLGRPELNAERFLPDHLSGRPGERLYRTGDRVRLSAGGELEFLGRFDHQVKVRGYRVELGEVEAAMAAFPGVASCAVLLREDQPGLQRLVGYLAPETVDEEALREHLFAALPAPAVPAALVRLPALPLNSNGKVDRKALPAPAAARLTQERGEAWLALHAQLRAAWEELLGVSPVGLKESFFALGGHSLLAIRMLARVERETGVRPPLREFFAEPTIERLAASLLAAAPASEEPLRLGAGEGEPFAFLHGDILGGGFYCRALAPALPRPMLVLAPDDLSEGPVPEIEELARRRLAALRKVQPRGPYRLGGYCIAGLLAHEMARLLEAEGETVASLLVVDMTPAADWQDWLRRGVDGLGGEPERRLRRFGRWRGRASLLADLLAGDGAALRARLSRIWSRRSSAGAGEAPRRGRDPMNAYVYAAAGHKPGAYRGPMTVLLARDEGEDAGAVRRAWRRVSPKAEVLEVPGDHVTCVTRHVDALAAAMAARLS
jgi:amino acid adenylation domain-containing protein